MASTSTTVSNAAPLDAYYRLTSTHLTALETAAQNLDEQLVQGMEDKLSGRWTVAMKKAIDFRIQALLVSGDIIFYYTRLTIILARDHFSTTRCTIQ